jgi:lysozyme
MLRTGDKGIKLIKHYESLHDGDLSEIGLQPKMDCRGIWTEGWGHAMVHKGKFLKGIRNKKLAYSLSTIHTVEEATVVLKQDLRKRENRLNSFGLDLKQWQFDALMSMGYNIGMYALRNSTLVKYIREGKPLHEIQWQFSVWNKSAGKVLSGLVKRRWAEAHLYGTGKLEFK